MDLFQYVKKYQNSSFTEEPFNEIDNIICSMISYVPLDNIVNGFNKPALRLEEAAFLVDKNQIKKQVKGIFTKKVCKLFSLLGKTTRYKDFLLYNYERRVDRLKQFCAITIKLPDNRIYVCYEGTDSAMVGWKEDAQMTYQFPIPAQELALSYLEKTVTSKDKDIMVGGHSKGGNLAVYAALECKASIRKKIHIIYNNDGPGFLKNVIESKKYKKIEKLIYKISPRESVVGMFLNYSGPIKIVDSKKKSFLQHSPFNWKIEGNNFIPSELSDYSKKVSARTDAWVERLDIKEREKFVEDLFDIPFASDIYDTYDFFKLSKTLCALKEVNHIGEHNKRNLLNAIKAMV